MALSHLLCDRLAPGLTKSFCSDLSPSRVFIFSLLPSRHIQKPLGQIRICKGCSQMKPTPSIRSAFFVSSPKWHNNKLFFLRQICFACAPKKQLAWLPGLGLLNHFRKPDHTLSAEVLANIPMEVLQKEKQKKKRRHIIIRILLAITEYIRFTLRLIRILITFLPLMAIYPIVCLNDSLKLQYWRFLLYILESMGTTFIKLGQWAGTRRDLFSPEFCDLFSCLHVRTMVHSWNVTKKRLRKAFGKRWREILVHVYKRPIGSGSIAQVYKAYMRADMIPDEDLVSEVIEDADDEPEIDFAEGLEIVCFGTKDEDNQSDIDDDYPSLLKPEQVLQESKPHDINDYENEEQRLVPVAVKVLHPGVYYAVHRDLHILSGLVWFVEKLFPSLQWLSLQECMAEFTDLLTRQIDLRMEAECLEEFNENFADHANIRFPKPVWPYCKRTVMVETFEEGEPITNYLVADSNREIPEGLKEKLASFGVDALLQMIFVDNFVHGDLHPGNILVQNATDYVPQEENKLMLVDVGDTVIVNVKPNVCPVRLVLLDAGITASLSEEDRKHFRSVFTAVVIGDGNAVAELMLRHARSNECKDKEAFKKELGDIVIEARKKTITLGQLQVGKLLSDVFAVLSKHRVKMESNFASILLAVFVLEGLGRSLDPEIDILERAKPILLG